ncbi:MAG: succinate dehydrogenase, hydrophobic membrane anchor protein [Rhodobacteraceae bacterium]|nr:MAG: succinate dehydrogenase, hydrophobic membrane anchor protein [Paracoccaceae bacterium]
MSYLTDRKRVQGLGSAKDGTGHFITQRVTAIALIPLIVLFVVPFGYNLGAGYERVIHAYAHPFNAIIAILFFATVFTHLRLGLQVVIEDYVHGHGMRTALLVANTLFCWLFGLTGVFAIAKIAL